MFVAGKYNSIWEFIPLGIEKEGETICLASANISWTELWTFPIDINSSRSFMIKISKE